MSSQIDYQRLKPYDDAGSGDALTSQRILDEAHKRNKQSWRLLFISVATLIIAAIIVIADLALHWRTQKPHPTMLECAKMTSPYSPIWEAVQFYEGDFDNAFNHSTIYRGPPTLEREEAWDKLWNHFGVGVDEAGLAALNKTHAGEHIPVKGSDPNHPTYGANIEVFHQLHCLNQIRRYTWPRELFDPTWGDLYPFHPGNQTIMDAVADRMHVDHCIEALRLSLMCYSDVTPVLVTAELSRALPFKADFNVHHKCRNFSEIVSYVDAREIDIN